MNAVLPEPTFKRPSQGVRYVLGTVLVVLVLVVAVVFQMRRAHHATEERAFDAAGNIARLLSHEVGSDYQQIAGAMQTVITELSSTHAPRTPEQIERLLAQTAQILPMIKVLRITDADGTDLYGPGLAPGRRINIGDRDYFRRLRDDPAAGLQVSEPLLGRSTGDRVIVFARRLERDDGSFAGVLLASYPLRGVRQIIANLKIADDDVVMLRSATHEILLIHPEEIGNSSDGVTLSAAFQEALQLNPMTGHYRSAHLEDRKQRRFAYYRNPQYGFYVNVGLTTWLPWRSQAILVVLALGLLFGLALLLAHRLRRTLLDMEESNGQLARSEAALAEAMALADAAADLARVGGWALELPARALTWATETYRIHEVAEETPIDWEGMLAFYPLPSRQVLEAALAAAETEGRDWDIELLMLTAGGREIWVRSRGRAERRDGHTLRILGVLQDIDERHRLEDKVLNSREQLRQFLDHLPAAVCLKNADLRVLLASKGYKEMFGMEPRDMVGRTTAQLYPGAAGERLAAAEQHTLQVGETEVTQELHNDQYLETLRFVIRNGEHRLLGCITRDVTIRMRQQARVEALLKIAELGGTLPEKEFLGFGLEFAEQLTLSRIGFLHFVNEDQETIELVTWTKGALQGCQAAYDSHYPISRAGIWADCFRARRAVVFNDYAGHAAKQGLPPGHAPLERLISVPVIEDGKVRMMIGVGNKTTDYDAFDIESVQLVGNDLWRIVRRMRVEDALGAQLQVLSEVNRKLTQAQNQLLQSEKMASIGQLAAGVAHELNNPIGFVQSNLNTMTDYVDDLLDIIEQYESCSESCINAGKLAEFRRLCEEKDLAFIKEDVRQLLAESQDGADRVRRIVQNLKDFSHVSEDEWQWTDLHKGLDSTLNLVWNEIKYKAEVVKAYGALPEVYCQASQINQVFMNLLVNAAQAIEQHGTITLTTGIEAAVEGPAGGDAHVWVEIADSGKGIPPDNLARIFDPFFTTKPVGKGTGLGLSLAWSIVEKHHGTLTVCSEVGVGTTFRMTLPLGRGPDAVKAA